MKTLRLLPLLLAIAIWHTGCTDPNKVAPEINSPNDGGWSNIAEAPITVLWRDKQPFGGESVIYEDTVIRHNVDMGGFNCFDLSSGAIKWAFDRLVKCSRPIIYNGDLFITDYQINTPFYRINAKTGVLKSVIWLSTNGSLPSSNEMNNMMVTLGPRLTYWTNGNKIWWGTGGSTGSKDPGDDIAVVSIDMDNLVDSGDGYNFIAKPIVEVRFENAEQNRCQIMGQIFFDNNLLLYNAAADYPLKSATGENINYGEIAAFNLVTKKMEWKYEIRHWANIMFQEGFQRYEDSIVASLHSKIYKLNIHTGKLDWSGGDGDSWTGGTIEGDLWYNTSGRPDGSNIICMNLKDGKYVWIDHYKGNLGANPIIHNGVCYVLVSDGIRIYNAKTGKKLGWSTNVQLNQMMVDNKIRVYNDTMIINDIREIICMKMDFRLGSDGKLVKD